MTVAEAVRTLPASATARRPPMSDGTRVLLLVVATIALRLLMFAGRGDYVAYDEGWYLLLGQSLFDGTGYSLSGLTHTVLSPLFPVLAGAVGVVLGDPIWAGRIVAAIAAGLLVWPCWHIFRRLAGRRTAWLACLVVVAMPALAPFVAAYWIGWDLWVGAEPLLQLFLFGALALVLRARERGRARDWLAAGALFGLAYLARPEAVIAFGVIGLLLGGALVLRRSRELVGHALAFGLAFALVASPYWLYLHDVLGRWALTGRGVELTVTTRGPAASTPAAPVGAAATIERMLWARDQKPYVRTLYGLDASGTRMASTYWGIPRGPAAAPIDGAAPAPTPPPPVVMAGAIETQANAAQIDSVNAAVSGGQIAASDATRPPSRVWLYARSLARIVPWFLWPLLLVGLPATRRTRLNELWVALPIACTSIAIAAVVAADPRTQLFVVPLACFYAARGVRRIGVLLERRLPRGLLRRRFVGTALATTALVLLIGTQARQLYMSIAVGSPHHAVGAENRRIGLALRQSLPPEATVMSWHPALALYARRDWRVLPYASFADIVRYADAIDARYVVLSPFYPGPRLLDPKARDHVVVYVPAAAAAVQQWSLELHHDGGAYLRGTLRPAAATSTGAQLESATPSQSPGSAAPL